MGSKPTNNKFRRFCEEHPYSSKDTFKRKCILLNSIYLFIFRKVEGPVPWGLSIDVEHEDIFGHMRILHQIKLILEIIKSYQA